MKNETHERSYDRTLVLLRAKNNFFFQKHSKSARKIEFFPKNDKNLLFNCGLFQQDLLTWNENLCEKSKEIEVKDRIQNSDTEDETILDFLAQYEV